ncbi:MAG TPA: diacylglycerol kinase family lipid kinase [Trueperaceae bacterium]|nr:diacylglycerol kinase family lipid kinase [Trueperaceae bacterium]
MYYLIANPTAGRGRSKNSIPSVQEFFIKNNLELKTFITNAPKHATELANSLEDNATIIALGGDGTVHEVATAIVNTNKTMGIIPAGSGDDLAFALDIPRNNIQAALTIIKNNKSKFIDTGQVNGETFVNSFGVGFDADVAYNIVNAPKFLKEKSAYLYAIFATLGKLKNIAVKVEVDDQVVFNDKSLLVSIQNGPRTGGSFLFAPEAKVDSGSFQVLIAANIKRHEVPFILPKLINGKHLSNPKISIYNGKNISLSWQKERPGHMEGEMFAASSKFDITILPRSLKVISP